jgi:hypothetical protein
VNFHPGLDDAGEEDCGSDVRACELFSLSTKFKSQGARGKDIEMGRGTYIAENNTQKPHPPNTPHRPGFINPMIPPIRKNLHPPLRHERLHEDEHGESEGYECEG